MTAIGDLLVGHQFPAITHAMTLERMSVYSDMEHSNTAGPGGRLQLAPKNIHNDRAFAQSEGFPEPIADGVILTAWIEAELREIFGAGYIKGGKLMTKFVRPVFAGDRITITMTLKEKIPEGGATRFNLDILCRNQQNDLVTVSTGSALVP